jgi:hypothetical protein
MNKAKKNLIKSMIGILLLFLITTLILLATVRVEFKSYLDKKYPNISFRVGIAKVNVIYSNFYAQVYCFDDGTSFPISKSLTTSEIHEDYAQYKSDMQYNSKIRSILAGSYVQGSIKSTTGGGQIPFTDQAVYDQVNIHLRDEADNIPVIKKIMELLKEKNLAAEKVIFMYEKDQGVYELEVSSAEYDMSETEIGARLKKIK